MNNQAVYLAIILFAYYIVVCWLLMRRFVGHSIIHRVSQIAIPASQVLLAELLMLCCALFDLPLWESFSLACLCVACGPADAFLFRLLDEAFSADEASLRLNFVQQQLQMQEESRKRVRLEAENASRIRAHMIEQLQAAFTQLDVKDAESATLDLERAVELAGNRPARLCSNSAADALLQMKAHLADRQGIAFEVSVDIPTELDIREIELCAVLANLIDNAMHATEKLPADKRIVRVSARMRGRYLAITVRNSFSPEDELALGASAARRKRAAAKGMLLDVEHGWGRDIVRTVAEQHEGTFESSRDGEGLFVASVVMLVRGDRAGDVA